MLELSLHRTLARQRRAAVRRRRRAGFGIVAVLLFMELVLFTAAGGASAPVDRSFLVQIVMLGAALVLFGVRVVVNDITIQNIDATKEALNDGVDA